MSCGHGLGGNWCSNSGSDYDCPTHACNAPQHCVYFSPTLHDSATWFHYWTACLLHCIPLAIANRTFHNRHRVPVCIRQAANLSTTHCSREYTCRINFVSSIGLEKYSDQMQHSVKLCNICIGCCTSLDRHHQRAPLSSKQHQQPSRSTSSFPWSPNISYRSRLSTTVSWPASG